MIRRNIELETRLIDDLLDVTRVGHGKLEVRHRRRSTCTTLIAHVVGICRRTRRRGGCGSPGNWARCGRGERRPGAVAAGALEPAQERGEVHARGRRDHGADDRRGGLGADPRWRCRDDRDRDRRRDVRTCSTRSSRADGRSRGSSAGWGWAWRSPRDWSMLTAGILRPRVTEPVTGRRCRSCCRP